MDQMSIPRVVITTRCNLRCSYCAGPKQRIPEASVREWIITLRKPEYKKIIFTGGEPLLYEGIWEIIEAVKKPVEIYTNLCVPGDLHIQENVTYSISIHDETYLPQLWGRVRLLALSGAAFSLHRVKGHAKDARDYFKDHKITVAEDQRNLPINKKPHLCNIRRVLFGPDAKRYPCCARMGEKGIGEGRYDGMYCLEPKCLPCDRFAQTLKEDTK